MLLTKVVLVVYLNLDHHIKPQVVDMAAMVVLHNP
tara:strand:+ start:200 stop:304 length:105 start_codon:yes stop_codon:yes gene_type:complete